MPLQSTRGAASSRGFGFGGGAPADIMLATGGNSTVYKTILKTTGSLTSFGFLAQTGPDTYDQGGSAASSTRMIVEGGYQAPAPAHYSVIQYLTFATGGNSLNFGNAIQVRTGNNGGNDNTRAVWVNGSNYQTSYLGISTIDYVTMATTGNASDFGDSGNAASQGSTGSMSSSTRQVWGGGNIGPFGGGDKGTSSLHYITTQTTGNSTSFGNITYGTNGVTLTPGAMSSDTRGLIAGGQNFGPGAPGSNQSTIHYITLATTGNTAAFGNLTTATGNNTGASGKTIGIFNVSFGNPESVTIASLGNSASWGSGAPGAYTCWACNNNGGVTG
jgi:hypothetical protein